MLKAACFDASARASPEVALLMVLLRQGFQSASRGCWCLN